MNGVFLFLLASSAVMSASTERHLCVTDEAGYCTEHVVKYELSAKEPNPRVKLNCALGKVLVVQLPAGESLNGDPAMGNAALFKFKLQEKPLMLMLWPTVPEGSNLTSADLEGETSNVQVNLASGVSILLELRISQQGVQRVVFRDPELEREQALRNRLRSEILKELEDSLKSRVENIDNEAKEKALSMVASGMLKRIHCTDLSERAMRDLLVIRAHRICQIGDYVFVELSVHNRARDLFSPAKVEMLAADGDDLRALNAMLEWEGGAAPKLKFDRKARAVAGFQVSEETAAAEYAIRVEEEAGKKRVVLLKGIEF